MIFAELPLDAAEGALLAHSVQLAGRRIAKGTTIDSALIAAARHAGLARLWVARPEAGDVAEAQAAAAIGAAVAGPGVAQRPPVHGRVNLHAAHDGLLVMDPGSITRANLRSEAVGIATLPPDTPVSAGDLVATVKIIPFALPAGVLDAVLAARPQLEIRPWRPLGAVLLVQTRHGETPDKLLDKTAAVTRERVARFGWTLHEAERVAHGVAPLAGMLAGAAAAPLILVAGATATADRCDVIPAAIAAAGGEVDRVGMPVDPGNLLVLGRLASGSVVVGLPGCARSRKRNGLDLVLERLAAFGRIDAAAVGHMGVGGLLEESGVPVPWAWQP